MAETAPVPRRVRLSLGASAEVRTAARLAADIAGALEAELEAVFLEDEEVLSLAALPVAREILASGLSRPMDLARMEADLRAGAASARRLIEQVSHTAGLTPAFRVERGSLAASLTAQLRPRDVVVLAASALGERPGNRLGEAIRRAATEGGLDIILTAGSAQPRRGARKAARAPIVVADDGSPAAAEAARLAERLARRTGAPVVRIRLSDGSAAALAREAKALAAGLLLVNAASPALPGVDEIEYLTSAARCSVLLVGGGGNS